MKYRKKPLVVEAIQYKPHENCIEVAAFMGVTDFERSNCFDPGADIEWNIHTRDGVMLASPGDWIIKEPAPSDDRRFYPCKPDIFEATYEPAE